MAKTAVLLGILFAACGGQGDLATLSIQVHSPSGPGGSLRRFPPNTPLPEQIQVQVFRAFADDDGVLEDKAVDDIDEAWEDLQEDPITHKKHLLVTVPSNSGKDYTYLLRLASLIENAMDPPTLYVDECGTIGNIVADKGAKVRLYIYTNLGDCSLPCSHDGHCVGERYCLSFECQDAKACTTNDDCPEGAYCTEQNCDSDCTVGSSQCTTDYTCCGGICSIHCPS